MSLSIELVTDDQAMIIIDEINKEVLMGINNLAYTFPSWDIEVRSTRWGKTVHLRTKQARDYVASVTGVRYQTINLPEDHSLLTALLLKFEVAP